MLYDYSTITPASVRAVVDDAIAAADATIDAIVSSDAARTWANTMAPLDEINAALTAAYGKGPFMARVHPDKEVRDAATEAEEKITKWSSDLTFRRDLYEAVEAFAATDEAQALEGEEARFLEFTRRDFRRAGHGLTEEQRDEVQSIRTRLVELGVAFGRNIDEYQDGMDLTREQLAGTDDAYISRLSAGETEGTFRVSLDYPDYYPFMDEADRPRPAQAAAVQVLQQGRGAEPAAPARRPSSSAPGSQPSSASPPGPTTPWKRRWPRRPRPSRSSTPSWSPRSTEMAEDRDRRPPRGHWATTTSQGWDYRYLHTAIRKERYGIDPNEVAAYFPLEQVLDGMFEITGEVFGLTYEAGRRRRRPGTPTCRCTGSSTPATGRHLATFYVDLFPREGKFGHAAAFDLVASQADRRRLHDTGDGHRRQLHQADRRHAVAAEARRGGDAVPRVRPRPPQQPRPHATGPVRRLQHRVGLRRGAVADHGALVLDPLGPAALRPPPRDRRTHPRGSGRPVGGGPRPARRPLHAAPGELRTTRHGASTVPARTRISHEITRETSEVAGFPYHEGTFYPASFGHLFGYDAGYYGYLWSKVYGDDMFSRFEDEGVLDPGVGMDYRRFVLEPGGSLDAADLLRGFLGQGTESGGVPPPPRHQLRREETRHGPYNPAMRRIPTLLIVLAARCWRLVTPATRQPRPPKHRRPAPPRPRCRPTPPPRFPRWQRDSIPTGCTSTSCGISTSRCTPRMPMAWSPAPGCGCTPPRTTWTWWPCSRSSRRSRRPST